jgi:hypothetical protein
MTIFKVELANDFPPLVMIVTKSGHKDRSLWYYTLGDNLTCDLENFFKGIDDRLTNLVHGGRV